MELIKLPSTELAAGICQVAKARVCCGSLSLKSKSEAD